ncbi:Protein RETICULATA-RELATED 6 like [Actinidia chinensis var. chinensis]|uniref:Protein RETICULATA-RELATED 6 like n=1 Tax=Actinidia chinensis var. chinensis TaxID=1590841 RepID=A0A2R6RTB1_ACTCC|nr:Protein RETICULATA-RELATED 6 like [Actinidia chinensis var. chinensis]
MSQIISQAMEDGGGTGMLIVVTRASHVTYGSRGTGLPARISRKIPKKNQVVILLDPERQYIRREEVPVADFLWYSAARPCSRNCFDRAEIARVMNAAGRRREALPKDLQQGLDLGVVSPEVLQNFFDLEQYPLISKLTQRFQGFRERLLADPKFLHRLAIEEAISITTTLLAQYERRKENFFEELDYVITDTTRGSVFDFFTVIAGIVEHRISDQFASQTLFVNMLSFVVRTVNSYWGTQQWIDLARFTGLQARESKPPSYQTPDSPNPAALECNTPEEASIDEIKNQ